MGEEWVRFVAEHWPTLALVAGLLYVIYHIVKAAALTFEAVGKALGPLGRMWHAKRTISQAEADDMRRQLQYLAEQVRGLRHRDECQYAYTQYDTAWHRKHELLALSNGWVLPPHVNFWEFSEKWYKDHGIEHEIDIWM